MEFCDRTNGRLTVRRKETFCAFRRLSHGCSARLRFARMGWRSRPVPNLQRSSPIAGSGRALARPNFWNSIYVSGCKAQGPRRLSIAHRAGIGLLAQAPPAGQIFIRPCPNPDRSISQKHKAWSCKGRSSLKEADSRTL